MLQLKDLECTKIVQNGSILWALLSNDLGAEASENERGRGGRTIGRLERPDQIGISGPQLPRSFDLKVERLRGGATTEGSRRENQEVRVGAPSSKRIVALWLMPVKNNLLAIRMDVAGLTQWGSSWRRERVCGRGGIRKNCGNLWKRQKPTGVSNSDRGRDLRSTVES